MLKTEIKYSNRERCFIRKIDSLASSHVFLSINKNAVILALRFVRLKHRDRSCHMLQLLWQFCFLKMSAAMYFDQWVFGSFKNRFRECFFERRERS